MKEKIGNFNNLEESIEKLIEKFNIPNSLYVRQDGEYCFNFNNIKIIFSNDYVVINGDKIISPKKLVIKKEKVFFKEKTYLNSILLKEYREFIESIIEEWKESKTLAAEVEATHLLVIKEKEIKIKYIEKLNFILEKITPLKVKKDKYIYTIGRALDLEEREIKNVVENARASDLTINEDKIYLLADLMNFFHINNLKYPKFKDLMINKIMCQEEKNYYLGLIEFFKNEDKFSKKTEKFFYKKGLNNFCELISQKTFYNNSKKILNTREKNIMSEKLKIEFIRDEVERYYYEFLGEEGENPEYLTNLETEEQVKIVVDEGNEELDFNEVLKSYSDNEVAAELSRKSSLYKKVFKNKIIKERKELFFPRVTYSDITEEIILGHLKIKKDYLQSFGIWGFQGQRWLQFSFESLLTNLREKQNISLDYNFKLVHYKNTAKEDRIDISKNLRTNFEKKSVETNDLLIEFPIDTNYLASEYLDEDNSVTLEFYFELIVVDNDLEQEFIFGIPVKIKLLNPEHRDFLSNEVATIDFGTSSTCIAINNASARRELLSLENPEEIGEKAYENPTNLLIKDWKTLYNIWKERENEFPIIKRYENIAEEGLYNQGYSLKEQLKVASKAELNAQINQLKLIPYRNLTLKEKLVLTPYLIPKVGIKEIELIGQYEEQNEEKFDAISFYGYLLGRVILSPLNGKILRRFFITVPVKFEKNVKESIINSLKNGIKLAVPEPLKDKIEVEEGHEEPIAFIGAICGHECMQGTKWGVNSKFAVFDFGGGTIDFSFGKYREPNDEINEELDYDRIIEVINTAGDDKGGAEYIIHRLSFYLYKLNSDVMKEKRIPFVVPAGENEIELFPRDLQIGNTKPAILNVNKINEEISRKIFEDKEEEFENNLNISLELQDENGNPQIVEISVEKNLLELNLKEQLEKQVKNFKKIMMESFKNEEDLYGKLHIFRAGNASRSKKLEEILNEEFKDLLVRDSEAIHFINEESVHGVKPKTAVALGELKLRSSNSLGVVFSNKIESDEVPFEFNVGSASLENDNKFDELISKGSVEKEWKKLGRVNKETLEFIVYYTTSLGVEEISNQNIKIHRPVVRKEEIENGNIVWIRPNVANKIEYKIARRKPEVSEEGIIIELPR